ncbi:MAG: hypothetical protein ACE37F_23405 [Nannocystaceae bacterium]|nr:hypothetical protein [bacterium]
MTLCILVGSLSLAACDSSSGGPSDERSGANSADGAGAVGGGFSPDPECAYDCVEATETETVCVQTCANDCRTVVMRREVDDGWSRDVSESLSEHCPDHFPEPQLWPKTCEILYGETDSDFEGDCDESYSGAACQAALDLCLPPQ